MFIPTFGFLTLMMSTFEPKMNLEKDLKNNNNTTAAEEPILFFAWGHQTCKSATLCSLNVPTLKIFKKLTVYGYLKTQYVKLSGQNT